MRRRNAQPLGDVIRQFLRLQGLETPLNEVRAVKVWPEVAGPLVAKLTSDVSFRQGTLYVKISRPALRQDLSMMRTELIGKVNAAVGAQVVQNIVFC